MHIATCHIVEAKKSLIIFLIFFLIPGLGFSHIKCDAFFVVENHFLRAIYRELNPTNSIYCTPHWEGNFCWLGKQWVCVCLKLFSREKFAR